MTASRLEQLEHAPATGVAPRRTPLLFLHGAYTSAWIWGEYFLPWFAARGWHCHAVSLAGHGHSPGHEALNALSIADYVRNLAATIAALPTPPVVIAHSMGGFVLQHYLARAVLPGSVLLCSVPPQGLAGSTLGLMYRQPGVMFDLFRIIGGGTPDFASVRDALFHQPVSDAQLARWAPQMQAESMRAVWDMCGFDLPAAPRSPQGPLLVVGAEHDALIPPAQIRATASKLACKADILADHGHALMLEPGWETPAAHIAAWLDEHGF